MNSLFKRSTGPTIAEPIPMPDPDARPPERVGPHGFMTSAYSRWEMLEAERRLAHARRIGQVGYTIDQTRQLVAAQSARNEAAALVDRLTEQRHDLDERRANDADALGSLAAQGYAPRQTKTAEYAQMVDELDRRLAPAVDRLRRADIELRQVTDAADSDLARRRSAVAS